MTRHQAVKIDPNGDAFCTRKPPDYNLAFVDRAVNAAKVFFGNEMDLIVDARILADPALETGLDDFSDQLYRHPALAPQARVDQRLRRRLRAYLRNYAIKIVVALRDAHETTDLADAVASPPDDRDARGNRLGLSYAHGGAGDASDPAEKGRRGHRTGKSGAGPAGGAAGAGSKLCGERELAKKRANASIAPSWNSWAPPKALDLQ